MSDEKNWKSFVEDINDKLKLEPEYASEDEAETLQNIVNRQGGEDGFVDEDFLPEQKIGLKPSTVRWLLENDVEVPETWSGRLKKAAENVKKAKAVVKKAKPAPAEDDEEEEEKPVKKTKAVATKAAPGEKKKGPDRAKNAIGHIRDTIADKIDQMFLKGTTEKELVAAGIEPSRFKGHFKHLLKDKADAVKVEFANGIYKAELLG